MFFLVLLALVLLGLLTAALMGSDTTRGDVDQEDAALQATMAARYGAELQEAVRNILASGVSETDIRFAAPSAPSTYGTITTTPSYQVFSKQGGNVEYKMMPASIFTTANTNWEFYATTDIPLVGTTNADLVAVLPDVTQAFCLAANRMAGISTIPTDIVSGATPDCISSGSAYRFGPSFTFDTTPNTLDDTTFTRKPALQACVACGSAYHYYYVLLPR